MCLVLLPFCKPPSGSRNVLGALHWGTSASEALLQAWEVTTSS